MIDGKYLIRFTPQEYLVRERASEYKSEFFQGIVMPMAGASPKHNVVAANLLSEVRVSLRHRFVNRCRVMGSDMRVRVPKTGLYAYPDIVVVCGNMQFDDARKDTLLNLIVVVEVLSLSTEKYDLEFKWQNYQTIESLQDCLVVAQDKPDVLHYQRDVAGEWQIRRYSAPEEIVSLQSIGCEVSIATIYEDTDINESEFD